MSMGTYEGGNNGGVVRVWPLGGFRVWVGSRTNGEDRWQRRKAAARRSRDPAAYRVPIDFYVGELLQQDRYEEWTEECRRRLPEMHHSLLHGLARLQEEREDHDGAAEALREALAEDPVCEEAHVGLIACTPSVGGREMLCARTSIDGRPPKMQAMSVFELTAWLDE